MGENIQVHNGLLMLNLVRKLNKELNQKHWKYKKDILIIKYPGEELRSSLR
jgi:hypothetical protein